MDDWWPTADRDGRQHSFSEHSSSQKRHQSWQREECAVQDPTETAIQKTENQKDSQERVPNMLTLAGRESLRAERDSLF